MKQLGFLFQGMTAAIHMSSHYLVKMGSYLDIPIGGQPEYKEIHKTSFLNTLLSHLQQIHDGNPPLMVSVRVKVVWSGVM